LATVPTEQKRPAIWRNSTFLKWAAQLLVLAGVVLLTYIAISQVSRNLTEKQLNFSFAFLSDQADFPISEGVDTQPATVFEALKVGAINMLRITFSGIIAATFLGVFIGIGRLSRNWLAAKASTVYIETIRNVPLLVQIIFWQFFVQATFAILTLDSGPVRGWFIVSNKGVSFAWLFPADGFWQWLAWLAVGAVAARIVHRWRMRRMEQTGQEAYALTYALVVFAAVAAVGWFVHPVMGFLGWILGAVSALFGILPVSLIQVLIALGSLAAGAWWIKRFVDSFRTPAGRGKMTDDDIFRMAFVGVLAVVGVAIAIRFPGVSRALLDWGERFFVFADSKFNWLGTGSPLVLSRPEVLQPGNFANYGPTGLTMTLPFFSVWIAVTLYTASFIAEIVRGGILAVPKGQSEAGLAMGLKRSQLLRLVVLPQAFRIILPPMGNQYLNLAKNTSLGIAVAFPEMVLVGRTVFNQTGRSVEVILIWMGFYLTISLAISFVVNFYNRRLQLVER
jgi:general L-amino acid transport system permease protein